MSAPTGESRSPRKGRTKPVSPARRRGKHGNIRVEYKGMKFDSKGECARYRQLEDMEGRGEIENLRRQVNFPLYAYDPLVEDKRVKVCDYRADHTYWRVEGDELAFVVEDFKGGPVTDVFRLKAKLFRINYGFDIEVVRNAGR